MESPSTGWGSLKRGEVGYVRAYKSMSGVRSLIYVCDFPSVDGWRGRADDLEVDPVANLIRSGKRVQVNRGVTLKNG